MTTRNRLAWMMLAPLLAAVPTSARAQPFPGVPAPQPPSGRAPAPADQPLGGGKDVPATSPPSTPPDPTRATAVELTTLHLMLNKGVLSQAEYDSAARDLGETTGMGAGEGNTFVMGRWATTLYGFVEADAIYDSTESLNEIAGNTAIARPGTYAQNHDRAELSIRNSRFGFRIKAPEANGVRASGQAEMDFFGTQLPFGGANPGTEAAVYNNSVLRVRHMNLKVETPIVDLLLGQYWTLFGWQAMYLPATVEVQGIPGEIFSRQMQVRVSKTVKTEDFTFEIAAAAVRPPQRDSGVPAGQGGVRFALNKVTAPQTLNLTGTSIQPLSVAVTGDVRNLRLPELSAAPSASNSKVGSAIAVDAFIPVVPGSKDHKGNSLALNGEVSSGRGTGDLYTGLTGGVTNPALPAPAVGGAAPVFNAQIDPGLAVYDGGGRLHLVQWTAFVVGLQYYLPGAGNVFVSANYARTQSSNTVNFGKTTATRKAEDFYDVNLFWDVTPAVRVAGEYAHFKDVYNDDTSASNERVQLSGVFLY